MASAFQYDKENKSIRFVFEDGKTFTPVQVTSLILQTIYGIMKEQIPKSGRSSEENYE